jgi:hypothetical protein
MQQNLEQKALVLLARNFDFVCVRECARSCVCMMCVCVCVCVCMCVCVCVCVCVCTCLFSNFRAFCPFNPFKFLGGGEGRRVA